LLFFLCIVRLFIFCFLFVVFIFYFVDYIYDFFVVVAVALIAIDDKLDLGLLVMNLLIATILMIYF